MKKISILFAVSAIASLALTDRAAGAGSTATGYSTKTGYFLTGTAADKWGAHGVAPTAQQTGVDQTAFKVLQNKGVIAPAAADYGVQHRTVALSAANIIAMYTTPVQILAAPGSSKAIVVTRLAFTMTRTATVFTGTGANVIFQYDSTANGAGTNAVDSTIAASIITGSAATTTTVRNGAVISDSAGLVNKGIYISNATGVFATGTGTASVEIWYVVVGGA